ncbi:Protein of unknown function [Pyronema omphalodes CBS 100304]|uniref:Uncharacterized protein n=1 Tax=Pyronema omphalodes (strain CBS 100304) TaxID=1076935 RepID=U4LI23_PYROM|nr:Protein of unknown function [Pyronema omphalodes CBS 100304]
MNFRKFCDLSSEGAFGGGNNPNRKAAGEQQ